MKRPPLSKSPAMEVSTCPQMVSVLCKVINLVWNRMKCYRRGLMSSRWFSSTWLLGTVGVSVHLKMRFARYCKQSFTLIKPTIYILLYVQHTVIQGSFSLHLYNLNGYFIYCPFYASKYFQLCWNVIFICLFNVRLKSMRLFPRLIIHSLFCCSWEIYDWLHDYIKTVSRLTDLKTTHLKTASFSPSFVPVVSGQSAALRDNTDQWGSPHPQFGSVNCN